MPRWLRLPGIKTEKPSEQARTTLEEEEGDTPDLDEDDEDLGDDDAEGEPEETGDASLEEVLAKSPEERVIPEEEDDEESMLSLGREERLETLSVKVEPIQEKTEFVCRKCYLVKPIRSQLADKKRMFCRDCV